MLRRVLFKSAFCLVSFSAGIAWGCLAEASVGVHEPAPKSVQCSAAFELMDRVSPSFTAQHSVKAAREFWRNDLSRLAARAGLDADGQIGLEMQAMANAAAHTPSVISDTAMQCVGDAPAVERRKVFGVF